MNTLFLYCSWLIADSGRLHRIFSYASPFMSSRWICLRISDLSLRIYIISSLTVLRNETRDCKWSKRRLMLPSSTWQAIAIGLSISIAKWTNILLPVMLRNEASGFSIWVLPRQRGLLQRERLSYTSAFSYASQRRDFFEVMRISHIGFVCINYLTLNHDGIYSTCSVSDLVHRFIFCCKEEKAICICSAWKCCSTVIGSCGLLPGTGYWTKKGVWKKNNVYAF